MQKSLDLIHVLLLGLSFMVDERPELFPEDHPIMILLMSMQGTPLVNSLVLRVEDQTEEDLLLMLYDVLNAAWKQVETYH